MRRFIIATLSAGLIMLASAASALAVPLHQHYITTPSGEVVPIAGGICKNELQTALDNLHANVHLGAPGKAFTTNPVTLTTILPCP